MLWLGFLIACGDSTLDTADCVEPVPDWDPWGQSFFVQWCDSCHAADSPNRYGAPDGVSFDTLDEVRSQEDRVRARVLEEGSMPPGGGVSDEELELLERLLDCSL